MLRKFLVFIVFILTISCQSKQNKHGSIEDFIPNDAQVVMHINSLDVFKSALKNNELLSKTKFKSIFENKLTLIDSRNFWTLLCVSPRTLIIHSLLNKTYWVKRIVKAKLHSRQRIGFSTSSSKSTPLKNNSDHPYKNSQNLLNQMPHFLYI